MALGNWEMVGLGTKLRKILVNIFDVWQPAATQTLTNKTLTSPAVTDLTGTMTSPTITTPTCSGATTLTGTVTVDEALSATWGAGFIGTGAAPTAFRRTENGVIITTIKFDITGLQGDATEDDCIGLAAATPAAYMCRYTTALFGVVFKIELICLETAADGGTVDIDLTSSHLATLHYGDAVGDVCLNADITAAGQSAVTLASGLPADDYVYIGESDDTADDSAFTAGQYIVKFYGHKALS